MGRLVWCCKEWLPSLRRTGSCTSLRSPRCLQGPRYTHTLASRRRRLRPWQQPPSPLPQTPQASPSPLPLALPPPPSPHASPPPPPQPQPSLSETAQRQPHSLPTLSTAEL